MDQKEERELTHEELLVSLERVREQVAALKARLEQIRLEQRRLQQHVQFQKVFDIFFQNFKFID